MSRSLGTRRSATSTAIRVVGTLSAVILAVVTATSVAASSGDGLDPTFGRGGIARIDLGGADHAVAGFRLPDGRYLVVGESTASSGRVRIGAARLTSDGHLDRAFGDNGRSLLAPTRHQPCRCRSADSQRPHRRPDA